ncbi:hypothetical protein HIM_04696 [Hirsutella minnesotensis 3608]|uniref:Uncharacterized protein n=1 Tax=Hirsutella minnesotensis 3608 TaxID=1043627 RepID=A0A0F8A150_9HYPO|nr:hypothetical protein HIM_04696 [Hirsutella minnesotensis 3608]
MAAPTGTASFDATPYTALEAPHTVLNPVTFPKVYSNTQPTHHQAVFAHFYPNGLPVTYNLMNGHDSAGFPSYYLENHLPIRFYTHPPRQALAKFSTMFGHKRFEKAGNILPARRVHLWTKDEIQSVCNSLRIVFWTEIRTLRQPARWDDLWEYFDAYDLYHYGALNLWNVINTLFDENKTISMSYRVDRSVEIGHFTDEWVKIPGNHEKLMQWDGSRGPILAVLSTEDWKQIRNLANDETSLIISALHYRRDWLLSGGQRHYMAPADLSTAYQTGNLVNWLSNAQVLGDNGLPQLPASEPVDHSPSKMNAAAPCFTMNGSHYYHPEGSNAPRPAVEQLRKSSEAVSVKADPTIAENGVVVAMGSSKPPPGWEKRACADTSVTASAPDAGTQQAKDAAVAIPVDAKSQQTVGEGAQPVHHEGQPSQESKTDASTNPAQVTVSFPKADVSIRSPNKSQKKRNTKRNERKTEQAHQSNNREPGTDQEQNITNKEASEVNKGEKTPMSLDERPKTSPEGPPTTPAIVVSTDRVVSLPPPQTDHQSYQTQHGDQSTAQHETRHLSSGRMPQGHQPGAMPAQYMGSSAPGLPPRPVFVNSQQRNYTAPGPAQGGFGPSMTESTRHVVENQYHTRNGNSHATHRGGSWHGGHHHKGRARGNSFGPRNDGGYAQSAGETQYAQSRRDDRTSRQNNWGFDAASYTESYVNGVCLNGERNNSGQNRFAYRPCACEQCGKRNRSVFVRVNEPAETPIMDVQARLKGGLGLKFGEVEEVLPYHVLGGMAFIVRFVKESSVPDALAFQGGPIPEKRISLYISAVFRSKWINYTWRTREGPDARDQHPQEMPVGQAQIAAGYHIPQGNGGMTSAPQLASYPEYYDVPHLHPVKRFAADSTTDVPMDRSESKQEKMPDSPSGHYSMTQANAPSEPRGEAPEPSNNSSHESFKAGVDTAPQEQTVASNDDQSQSKSLSEEALPDDILFTEQTVASQNEQAQSKPPSEEVLPDGITLTEQEPGTPESKQKGSPAMKARVALPPSSPVKKGTYEKASSSLESQPLPAKSEQTLESEQLENKPKAAMEASEKSAVVPKSAEHTTRKVQEARPFKPAVADQPHKHSTAMQQKRPSAETENAQKSVEIDAAENVQAPSEAEKRKPSTEVKARSGEVFDSQPGDLEPKAGKQPALVAVTEEEPVTGAGGAPKAQPKLEKVIERRFPIFTEEEIRARKQSWNRIPMPLKANKVGKPIATVTETVGGKVKQGELISKLTIALSKDDSLEPATSTEKASEDGSATGQTKNGDSKTTVQEVSEQSDETDAQRTEKPAGSPSKPRASTTDSANQDPSEKAMLKDAPTKSHTPKPSGKDVMHKFTELLGTGSNSGKAVDIASKVSKDSMHARDGSVSSGPDYNHDTIRRKHKKNNRKFKHGGQSAATSQTEAAQAGHSRAVSREESRGEDQTSKTVPDEQAASGGSAAPSTFRSAKEKGTEAPVEEDNKAVRGTDSGSSAAKDLSASQENRPQSNAPKPRHARHDSKQGYRANAGGSLRMQKTRRNQPQASLMQTIESPGPSTGTIASPSSSSSELISRNNSDANLDRQEQQDTRKGAQKTAVLNPLASVFVSPPQTVEGGNETRNPRGEDRGGLNKEPNTDPTSSPSKRSKMRRPQAPSHRGDPKSRDGLQPQGAQSKQGADQRTSNEATGSGAKRGSGAETGKPQGFRKKNDFGNDSKKQHAKSSETSEAKQQPKKDLAADEWPSLPKSDSNAQGSTMTPPTSPWTTKKQAAADTTKTQGPSTPVKGKTGLGQGKRA